MNSQFIIEFLIVAIHPLPYVDYVFYIGCLSPDKTHYIQIKYLVSDFLLTLMFLRIIFLIRSVFNYTSYTDIYAKRLW